MALARFGGGVSELRGSIAGNVYSRARAGAIVRNRTKPVNPNTDLQSQSRSWMQYATDAFADLDKDTIQEWNDFATTQVRFNRLGEPYTPTGKQLYTESSINQLTIGESGVPDLADNIANPNLPSLEVGSATVLRESGVPMTAVQFETVSSNFGTKMLVQATPELPPTITNFKKYLRTIGVFDITSTPAAEDMTDEYELKYPTSFNTPFEGGIVGFRASAVNPATGLASEWIYATAVVPPAGA